MQNGPRYLTDTDINTIQLYTPLTAGGVATSPWSPGYNADPRELGYEGVTANGRTYRFCLIGGTSTVTPGTLLVAPAAPSNSTGLAIAALTAQPQSTATGDTATGTAALSTGSLAFAITNGSTSVTQDQFAGGYVDVLQTSGTNPGPTTYQLRGNSAGGNGATVTLYLAEPLQQLAGALTPGTDTVNLRVNTYANVVSSSTLAQPVGIVPVQVPNSASAQYYAWIQTKGQASAVAQGSITAFNSISQSTTTAGSVAVTSGEVPAIGSATQTGVNTDPVSVFLNLG